MIKSAGLLAFRRFKKTKILLVHPGGPFYKNKDDGVWSIPKGEYTEEEKPLDVAKREFFEETGNIITSTSFIKLPDVKTKGGKLITSWAVECNEELSFICSNMFEIEWPPKSGKKAFFPEVDKAEWFSLDEARKKINSSQIKLIDELESMLQQGV